MQGAVDYGEGRVRAYQEMFETYGRNVEVEYVTSTGDDEVSQRADALAVLDKKPFIVADGTYTAHGTFETAIASAKVVVYGAAATSRRYASRLRTAGADRTWRDTTANLAEFLGKRLAGKKAQWAGDADLQGKPRKFGLVSIDGVIEEEPFAKSMAKNKVQIAAAHWIKYAAGPTGTTVDSTVARAGARHHPAAEGRRRHVGDPVHHRRDDDAPVGAGHVERVLPGVDHHRLLVHEPPDPLAEL